MKKAFNLQIVELGNAAFDDAGCNAEVARILREVADKMDSGSTDGAAWDINGNRVGSYSYRILASGR